MASLSSLPECDNERSRSESPFDITDREIEKFDPNLYLERSTSEAELTPTEKLQANRSSSLTPFHNSDQRLEKSEKAKVRVSESTKVYFDLSKIDGEEEPENNNKLLHTCSDSRLNKVKIACSLETIPQGEELSISRQSIYSEMSTDHLSESGSRSELDSEDFDTNSSSFFTKYPLVVPNSSPATRKNYQFKANVKLTYQKFSERLENHITPLKSATSVEEIIHLQEILSVLKEAWGVSVYGRDLAYGLCDALRLEGVLDLVVKNCGSSNRDLMKASAALLEQSLSTKNRERVSKAGLETVIGMTYKEIGNHDMSNITTGILEGLFKVSEDASTKIVILGGLDVILHWCRSTDIEVLRHCAKAIANLSLFGGAENQEEMARRNVPEWLFPLAFNEDNNIRYYACLAVSVLVANKELEAAVIKSGTLELVMPFISSNKPTDFAKSDFSHKQGRDRIWLLRLVPLLSSRREEAQVLAAFHFAMEAGIKAEQGRLEVS